MKLNTFITLSLLVLAAAVSGCHSGHDARLEALDSALWRNPDSVYEAIGGIDTAALKERDKAFLKLLRAEAADKSNHTDTTSATISALEGYYLDGDRESDLHPRVNYILGRIHIERGEKPKALEYFRRALRSSDENTDPRLMMAIYGQTADLCSRSKLHRHGLVYAKGMVDQAKRLDDPLMIARSELMLAYEYRGLNQNDSALRIYERLAPFFAEKTDSVQQTIFATQLAAFYKERGDYDRADSVIRSSGIAVDGSSKSSVGSIINDIDLHFGRTEDLERRSLALLADSDDIYARKTAAKNLFRIYLDRGDARRGLYYAERFHLLSDSISEMEAASAVAELSEFYSQSELAENNLALEKGNSELRESKSWQWIIILALVVVMAVIIIIWQRNKIKTHKKIGNLENTLADRKRELENLLEELAGKTREIADRYSILKLKDGEINARNLIIEQKNIEIEQKEKVLLKIHSNINELEFTEQFIRQNKLGAPESELGRLEQFVKGKDPRFYERMKELKSMLGLSTRDFNDTLLIRFGISLKTCSGILLCTPEALGAQRKRMMAKVEDKRGETKWENYIRSFSFSTR